MATATATANTQDVYERLEAQLVSHSARVRERAEEIRTLQLERARLLRSIPDAIVEAGVAGASADEEVTRIKAQIGELEGRIEELREQQSLAGEVYDRIVLRRNEAVDAHRAARAAELAPELRQVRLQMARALADLQAAIDAQYRFFERCRGEGIEDRFDAFGHPRLVEVVRATIDGLAELPPAQLEGIVMKTRLELGQVRAMPSGQGGGPGGYAIASVPKT